MDWQNDRIMGHESSNSEFPIGATKLHQPWRVLTQGSFSNPLLKLSQPKARQFDRDIWGFMNFFLLHRDSIYVSCDLDVS